MSTDVVAVRPEVGPAPPRPPRRLPRSLQNLAPLSPTQLLVQSISAIVAALLVGFILNLTVLSHLQHFVGQQQAGNILRGGAWIGSMERAAIFTTLIAGWPEGLAIVLAMKGLGRYPELKQPGAAERFIIGSFTSVLWAIACAGVLWSLLNVGPL